MAAVRNRPARAVTAAPPPLLLVSLLLILPLLVTVAAETVRVNNVTPRHVGYAGGEIVILGSGFAKTQYSQTQPELGNIVNFVNDWASVPCKVIAYLTSSTKIVCTVGPLRPDSGLNNRYTLHLTVDGQHVYRGWFIQYHNSWTPRLDSVEPATGPVGSLITLRGNFFTDRYSIDTETAGDLQQSDLSIKWIRVGSGTCDPVNQTSGELYGLTSSTITCRVTDANAGPLPVRVLVTNRGISAVKNNKRLVSSWDSVYDFLAVPQVSEVRPTSLEANGGAIITVKGTGFDPEPGATAVTIGGAACSVLSATSTQVTCTAPADRDTVAEQQGGAGLQYEVWPGAEVSDLDDLSSLSSASDGYLSVVVLGAAVSDELFGAAAADWGKLVGRLSGWLRSPRRGQFMLTLKSDGASQLKYGMAPASLGTDSAVETSGGFSLQKSAMINMTDGQMLYFEATHKEVSASGGYRLQVGLVDYESPVLQSDTSAATIDTQTLYIKGDLLQERQVLSFDDVPAAALNAVQLEYNGVVSQTPVDADTATEDTWRSAVEDLFSAQCTYDAVDQAWMRTYEDATPQVGRESGTRQNETVEPWCGSWVMYKPWGSIWSAGTDKQIELNRHRWFCLAHRGKITGYINMLVEYRNDENTLVKRWTQFNAGLPSTESWSYSCVDLVDNLEEAIKMPATLIEVRVPFNWAEDVYFDDVSFSAAEKTPPSRRPAARLGLEPLFVRQVEVTTSAGPLTVTVTLKVAACASGLSLIRIAGTNATAVADTSDLDMLPMTADGWGQGVVKNMRNVSASPAPAGSWDIKFGGLSVEGVPTNLTAEGMTLLLATRLAMPGLVVTRWGECNQYHWQAAFKYHGGIQPDITVNGSDVQFDGNNLQTGVWKDPNTGDSRLTHDVLPADLTRLPRSAAGVQVKVTVTGVTAQCVADCDVTYDNDLSAEVTAVSSAIDETSGDATVTITGSGLGTAPEGLLVTLTGALTNRSCTVTSATGSEVICTVKKLQAGRYNVAVTVTDAGAASGSGEVVVAPSLLSVSPVEGSPRGGTVITLRGRRLPHAPVGWLDGTVSVGGASCSVLNSTSTATSCWVQGDVGPAGSAVDVTVTFGDRSATLESAFTPLSTNAVIAAINVTSASAAGGDILGITGTGFGRLQMDQSVTVGGAKCDVTFWRDTQISCRLPPLTHGSHSVEVIRGQLGLADNSAVSPISIVFKVTDFSPRLVSVAGGSLLRVLGEGLGTDCDQLNITAGDLFTCQPVTCADTEVTCRLQPRRRRHVIQNTATHPRYGRGFLWEPQNLTVVPGDLITWRWTPGQVSSSSVGFAVYRTEGQASDEYKQGGFNSGDKTQQGSFTTMLEDIGTVFYSGPPAGASVPRMRGVINVMAPPAGDASLSVRIGSVETNFVPSETAVEAFAPSDLCSTDTIPSFCPDMENPIQLRAADYVTPWVTAISFTPADENHMLTAASEVIISGSEFSPTACLNRVMIGEGSCDVTEATANQLTCRVSAAGLPHGAAQALKLTVANRAAAVIDVAAPLKYFRSEPTVSGSSPASGSPTGGTLLTISGSGLLPGSAGTTPRVTVGTAACVIRSVTLSEVTCLTPAGTAGDPVPVRLEWYDEQGQPRTIGNSTFTYDATKTPTVISAELSADDGRSLTIAGTKFGTDASKISVILNHRSESTPLRRRRRQADDPPVDDALPGTEDDFAFGDVTAPDSEDVISLDGADAVEEMEPAMEEARRENAAFWRRFCHGGCDSFDAFVSSGQLRVAGSGPAVPVPTAASSPSVSGDEQDFVELTPEYVRAFHAAAESRSRERGRVHLRRRRRRSIPSSDPSQELTCNSVTLSEAGVTCQPPENVSGTFNVQVRVSDLGSTAEAVPVAVKPLVTTASLSAGSQHGGDRIRLDGAGFGGDVSVTVGGPKCNVTASTATSVECVTPPGQLGAQPLVVMSGGLSVNGPEYTYSADATPVITSVNSQDDGDISVLSGVGTGLGTASGAYVTVGDRLCSITTLLDTEFTCELESHLSGGQHSVTFHSPEGTGDSASFDFSVTLEVTSVSPATAGLRGTTLTIAGGKFDTASPVNVTVCDAPCHVTSVTMTTVTCLAPAVSAAPTAPCDVTVTLAGGASAASADVFTYDASLTAAANLVTPTRGGTAGGTAITITGTGFAESGNTVTIDGVTCDVTSESVTEVVCVTNGHAGPGLFEVLVDVPGIGFADVGENARFQYVDRWSSPFTWGGSDPPSDGQSVSITAGQTILLDTSTPVLKLILIDGGELIFDPDGAFLELNAEYIVVVGGGKVQIGTEESPHEGQAAITLHGNVRATELPVYGAKVLAVRNGSLELHGKPIAITWTYLASTAAAGATSITLDRAVSWQQGDEIVIASTGDKHSMGESEKHVISAVSADGLTLTLESPLAFEHISSEQTFAGQTVRMRAEVGLLTRNVKIRGSVNDQFTKQVQACAARFEPGQFDVQTCFHGRYGAETITDQFGATVMIHAKYQNQHLVSGRIEYVEVTEAGQAFRLGRYPIHYHLNGNVTGSYVRGCAIHRTYNRAVTIHAVDYLLVEHNVAYNVMGHTFFTEDGNEAYNVIQYNLAVFTRSSSSLLNVDVIPASYWVVNPTNIVRHNAAAGGTHFGYWYRTERHPSGPSFTNSYCPNHAPMGEFYNNSAHSFGRYGLWVFSMDGYFPLTGGEDTCSGQAAVARFGQFLAWRCERGAEVVFGGALRFENFTVVDNEMAGLEMVKVKGPFGNDGPGVQNALVVGRSALAGDSCTKSGIITPKQYIFNVDGATFVNFDGDCTALSACSQCKPQQGGFHHQFRRIVFENSPNKMKWQWTHESVFHDTDGSLSGEEDGLVLPWTDILPPDHCTKGLAGFDVNPQVLTGVCDSSISIHRMAFNQPKPTSLKYKKVNFTTQHGTTSSVWHKKRLTHPSGWMALLVGGETHNIEFADSNQLTNISYNAGFYFLRSEDRLAVSHTMLQKPDRFQAGGASSNGSAPPLDFSSGKHGDIHWDNDTYTMSYMVAGQTRSRRAVGPFEDRDKGAERSVNLVVERCFFDGCLPPPVPTVPTGRPDTVQLWSQATDGKWTVPGDMEDVTVPADLWVLTDVTLPPIRRLIIYGVLEIGDDMDNVLNCTHIVVYGKLVAGTVDQAFQHQLTILLRGRHRVGADAATADIPMPSGTPNIGWKTLATFGGLELYGTPSSVQWTSLATTAASAADSVQLTSAVDWPIGAEVVITTSSFESRETEVRRVTAVSDDGTQLTLNDTLMYEHLAAQVALPDDKTKMMSAKVGLLTRNIRLEGDSYDDVIKESFGARVLASSYYEPDTNEKKTASVHLSNVEFRLAGQDGWSDSYDPRYALALHSLDDKGATIVNCSFNHLFSPAIGIFYSDNVDVRGSVIMHTVGSGIIDEGSDNRLENNLVSWLVFPGTYNNRDEPENLSWDAAFRVNKAKNLTLIGNVAAGSERLGFHIGGTNCSVPSNWANNEAHGALHGVHMFGKLKLEQCAKVSGFFIWRSWDFGIYFHVPSSSVVIDDNVLVENTINILPMLYAPDPLAHMFENKRINVSNTVVVAMAAPEHCRSALAPVIAAFRSQVRAPRTSTGGRSGIVWGQFLSNKVGAPKKTWHKPMSYPAVRGNTYLNGVHLVNFNRLCSGQRDIAISTLAAGDDAQHPLISQSVTFINTNDDDRLFMHEPVLARVNPSDCVDMDCDGQKHALLIDKDGSIIGSAGTAVPQAEYEYDGDTRRGIGDYRVPNSAITDLDGNWIPYADKMPNKGVWRGSSCTWKEPWRAYSCPGGQQRMLVIESMDADTEVRRLSPIALVANPGSSGFVDLLNGPQDQGWCFGYTCNERISTFYSLVAPGRVYEMHFTSTPPQHLRFHFLNAEPDMTIVLKIWYPKAQRYDVYTEEGFVYPTNVEEGTFKIIQSDNPEEEFVPKLTSTKRGENYFMRREGFLHVLIHGPGIVEIKQQPVIVLKMGMVLEEDFYEQDLLNRLADLLDISPSMLRVANIVREDSGSRRRRRRETATTNLEVEIGSAPASSVSGSDAANMTFEQLQETQAKAVDSFQTGKMDEALGAPVGQLSMVNPEPPATDPTDGVRATNVTGGEDLSGVEGAKTYSELQRDREAVEAAAGTTGDVSYERPAEMVLESAALSGQVQELTRLSPPIKLYMKSATGERMSSVGHASNPWQVQAELVSPSSEASLLQDRVPFVDGVATFSQLMFSGVDTGLRLKFRVVQPTDAVFLVDMPGSFETVKKQLGVRVAGNPSEVWHKPGESISPGVRVEIIESATGGLASAAALRGYKWVFEAAIWKRADGLPTAALQGTKRLELAPPSGGSTYDPAVMFNDLKVTPASWNYWLQVTVTSPSDIGTWMVTVAGPFHIQSLTPANLPVVHTARLKLMLKEKRLETDNCTFMYDKDQFAGEVANFLNEKYESHFLAGWTRCRGRIVEVMVTTRDWSEDRHRKTMDQLHKELKVGLAMTAGDGTSYSFDDWLLVDGLARRQQKRDLPRWALALICVLATLLFAGILVLIWICCCNTVQRVPSGRVQDVNHMAFKVPVNSVPPPPFTNGAIDSFNIRMSITDPNNKTPPSIIQVVSDDPLVNLEDLKLGNDNELVPPLTASPPVVGSCSSPARTPAPAPAGELMSVEEVSEAEAKAQDKQQQPQEGAKQAEKGETDESDDDLVLSLFD